MKIRELNKKLFFIVLIIGFFAVTEPSVSQNHSSERTNTESISGTTLNEKLAWLLKNSGNGGEYIIDVVADETITPKVFSSRNNTKITLRGPESGKVIITLSKNGSMFTIKRGVTFILGDNIILKGNTKNNASMVVIDSGSNLFLEGGEISGNKAASGGGVYINGGTFTMNKGKISGNISSGNGGGIYIKDGSIIINDGEISGNKALKGDGGGIYRKNYGKITMNGGKISGNEASYSGSWKASYGGGVCGDIIINNGEISSNKADHGGGIYGHLTMNGGKISGNTANTGGGIHYRTIINGGEISGNRAVHGGGVYGHLTMNGGEISNNTAYEQGGGVYSGYGNLEMTNGKISRNKATGSVGSFIGSGGGIYIQGGDFYMSGGEISGNITTGTMNVRGVPNNVGGGLFINYGGLFMSGGVIYGDNAAPSLINLAALSPVVHRAIPSVVLEYGILDGKKFIKSGDIPNTTKTIRVVNGNLLDE